MFPLKTGISRRGLLTTAAGVVAVTTLAACDQTRKDTGATTDLASQSAQAAGGNLDDLMDYNPQPVENLEKGGTLTLSFGSLGPNFNGWANAGNNADTSTLYSAIDRAGVWHAEKDGTPVLNKDFCLDAKYDENGDKPVITYTLNPEAKYNDGTPFNWKVMENMWHMLNGEDKEIDVVSTDGYDRIESVKAGKDEFEVIVTMKEIYQPWTDLFAGCLAPQVNTKEIFNNGFVNNMHPEWTCGPFKLEKMDTTQKRVTLVPNEKWWGDKPILDRIVYVQMESQATIPAFKNGEIDATGVSTAARFNEIQGTKNMEIRRGQNLAVYGYNFNSRRGNLGDKAVRKAIYQGVDRSAIAKIRFTGLNWTENLPGSWMLMPFSPLYQDNYPVEYDVEAAKKTLEDAGWKANGDEPRTKDGKKLTINITNFGDDPTINAMVQTLQKQLTGIGFDAKIDAKGSGDFGKVMEDQSFELVAMGYSVGSDPTGVVNQFFNSKSSSNMTGTGSAEIDEKIPEVSVSPDQKERAKKANELEKLFQEEYAMMPVYNGPIITAYQIGLANYGPMLFQTIDWSKVGWEKGHKRG